MPYSSTTRARATRATARDACVAECVRGWATFRSTSGRCTTISCSVVNRPCGMCRWPGTLPCSTLSLSISSGHGYLICRSVQCPSFPQSHWRGSGIASKRTGNRPTPTATCAAGQFSKRTNNCRLPTNANARYAIMRRVLMVLARTCNRSFSNEEIPRRCTCILLFSPQSLMYCMCMIALCRAHLYVQLFLNLP